MATEALLISAFDQNSLHTWSDESNAIGTKNDNVATASDSTDPGWAGFSLQNASYEPNTDSTDIVSVVVRHKEQSDEHDNDNFYLEFYNNHTSSWTATFSPWPPGSFPTTLTNADITSYVRTAYGAASDKKAFIDNFAVRLRMDKVKGDDGINWQVAWCELVYNYTPVVYKSWTSDAFLKGTNTKSFTSDAYVCLKDTAYIDSADANNSSYDSDAPACNAAGTDYKCGTASQNITNYDDEADSGIDICYDESGGTSSIAEGLGAEENYGPAPVYPANGDAKKYFGKTVNFAAITYITTEVDGSIGVINLSGMSNSKKYTITVCGMRGNYTNRWTEYELNDYDSFTADHSSGTISGGTPTGKTCRYVAGHNWTEGYVARWKDVVCGTDGDVQITFKGVAQGGDAVNKGYLTAIIIEEQQITVNSKSWTSDAYLTKKFSKNFTSDSYLVKTLTKSWNSDAYLKKVLTKSWTSDAWLLKVLTKSWTSDAYLYDVLSKSFTSDGYLFKVNSKSFTSDAWLKKVLIKSWTSDAYLSSPGSFKSWTSDAYLKGVSVKTFTSDGYLFKVNSKSFTSDARLIYRLTKSWTSDGFLYKQLTKSWTSDGYTFKLYTKSWTSDGYTFKLYTKTFTSDGYLFKVNTKSFTSDALLFDIFIKSFTSDAWLLKVGWKSFTSDSWLIKTSTKSFISDAWLLKVFSKSFTSDGFIYKQFSKSFTSDAWLLKVFVKSFTSDAFLITEGAATKTISFTSDAIVSKVQNVAYGITTIGLGTGFTNIGWWEHEIGWPRLILSSIGYDVKTKGNIAYGPKAMGQKDYKPKVNGEVDYDSKAKGHGSLKPKGTTDA